MAFTIHAFKDGHIMQTLRLGARVAAEKARAPGACMSPIKQVGAIPSMPRKAWRLQMPRKRHRRPMASKF
jgi:hypothetical protein